MSRSPTSCSTSSRRSRGVSLPFPLFVFPPPPPYKASREGFVAVPGRTSSSRALHGPGGGQPGGQVRRAPRGFCFCLRPHLRAACIATWAACFFSFVHRLSAAALRVLRYVRAHVCEAHAQSPRTAAAWLPRSRSSRAGTVFVSRTRPRTWMSRRSYQWLLALASQARFRSASRARVDAALVACWSLL